MKCGTSKPSSQLYSSMNSSRSFALVEFHKFIAEDLENQYNLDNLFCIFKNSAGTYLVYSQPDNTIISYDLINNKVVNEKKNAHESYISNFRYQNLDGKDVIMSISGWDNNLKLWNFNN